MSWPRSACMVMTRPFRFWRKARPTPADVGFMFATTSHSVEHLRRPRCFITLAIARVSIRGSIWPDIAGSSRPMPLMDIACFMSRTEAPDASWRRHVGFMPGACSSPWPILMRTHAEKPRAKGRSPFSHRDRNRAPHRRPVRDRAAHQRQNA